MGKPPVFNGFTVVGMRGFVVVGMSGFVEVDVAKGFFRFPVRGGLIAESLLSSAFGFSTFVGFARIFGRPFGSNGLAVVVTVVAAVVAATATAAGAVVAAAGLLLLRTIGFGSSSESPRSNFFEGRLFD